jgi:ankyrin repeat protein
MPAPFITTAVNALVAAGFVAMLASVKWGRHLPVLSVWNTLVALLAFPWTISAAGRLAAWARRMSEERRIAVGGTTEVRVNAMDGTTFTVNAPTLGSIAHLRTAVAAQGGGVPASTVALFVTGRDGEALRDNQRLVDILGGQCTAVVFMLLQDACWTCAACSFANVRSTAVCRDCGLSRPCTERQSVELMMAVQAGYATDVSAFMAAAVPLDGFAGRHGQSVLYIASHEGHVAVVEALLAAGADKDAKAHNGSVAFHSASQAGHVGVMKVLLAAGADTDAKLPDGTTALHDASQRGQLAVVKVLLAAGADKDIQVQDGTAPLHLASKEGHLGVVEALVAASADTEVRAQGGFTALHIASREGYLGMVEALLAGGADKDARQEDGLTALHEASRVGGLAVVAALLAAGVDKDAAAEGSITALHMASRLGHLAVVEALLAAGADKDMHAQSPYSAAGYGATATALHLAREEGHSAVVDALRGGW